jgi:ABC-type Na+ efflux pump permease subunit
MNQVKLLVKATKSVTDFLEFNPQFLREIKGRFKRINIIMAVVLSGLIQLTVVISHLAQLPDHNYLQQQYSRYCFGQKEKGDYLCQTNLLGNWDINWQLFWLDIFIELSVIAVVCLLIGGVYLLITDLVKEKTRGTLDFIRFTPQSANSIIVGKILGVPILLYLAILLALPLYFVSALKAGISLNLLLGFALTIIACCWLFYSLATLLGILNTSFVSCKPWLSSAVLIIFLWTTTAHLIHNYSNINSISDWLLLFNPLIILPYLVKNSHLTPIYFNDFPLYSLEEISFYGQDFIWEKVSVAIGFILVNCYIWQYWTWQGLKRCFNNSKNTCFSKSQSYWITGCFVFYALGFTLQTAESDKLFHNFLDLQFTLLIFFLVLMACLSPKYQTLQDWARYRHQLPKSQRNIWQDLLFGAKSPAIVAVAVNLAIATIYIIPSLLIFSFTDDSRNMIWGLIIGVSALLLYGFVAQSILLIEHHQRTTWSFITVLALIIVPPVFLSVAGVPKSSSAFLVTFFPTLVIQDVSFSAMIITLLGQWLTIALTGWQITRQLHQLGKTETYLISD